MLFQNSSSKATNEFNKHVHKIWCRDLVNFLDTLCDEMDSLIPPVFVINESARVVMNSAAEKSLLWNALSGSG